MSLNVYTVIVPPKSMTRSKSTLDLALLVTLFNLSPPTTPLLILLKRTATQEKLAIFVALINGHTVIECHKLRLVLAQANYIIMSQPTNIRWMLDSGASHNITLEL